MLSGTVTSRPSPSGIAPRMLIPISASARRNSVPACEEIARKLERMPSMAGSSRVDDEMQGPPAEEGHDHAGDHEEDEPDRGEHPDEDAREDHVADVGEAEERAQRSGAARPPRRGRRARARR